MTVAELIARLQENDPAAPVVIDLPDTYYPVTTVRAQFDMVVIG